MREGWKKATIGEECRVVNGGTPKTKVSSYWDGSHAWITPAEMGKRESPYLSNTARNLTDEGLAKSSANLLPPKSVILSSRAPIGHLVVNEIPMAFNQGCKGLIPSKKVYYKYLYYFLYKNVNLLNDLGTGTTFKELSATRLKGIPIPIPPIPEQKRIVALLDEAFEGIGQAVKNAEKNLANARELFESYLNSVFTQKGEGWEEKTLGDISTINYGYTTKASNDEIGPKFLRITDIQDGNVNWTTVPFCKISPTDHMRHKLLDGDIVFARTGATTGKSYLLIDPPDVVCASYLIRLRVHEGLFAPDFLSLFFQTRKYWDEINAGISGSAQGGFNASKLATLTIPTPPLAEQREIAEKMIGVAAETQSLEAIYQQKLAALAGLKQSLLQKAFAGELTAELDIVLKEEAVA